MPTPDDIRPAAEIMSDSELRREFRGAPPPALVLDDIRARHRARVRWEVWDGATPVNGLEADALRARLRERGDWPEGAEVYLGYVDDELRVLQPHAPIVRGLVAMDPGDVDEWARNHMERVADDAARAEIYERAARSRGELP